MSNPNRIVIEVDHGIVDRVSAERPDEVMIIIHDLMSADICGKDYEPPIYGDGGLPIEPLAVVPAIDKEGDGGFGAEYEVDG